ncbi:GPI mannosyltransferase 1 [Lecanora helva]
MLAQTFAFVTFNKVCTSQFISNPNSDGTNLEKQSAWLYQAYLLEFFGQSTFMPGLFMSSLAFFSVNCWILGIIITDVGGRSASKANTEEVNVNSSQTTVQDK